MTIYTTKEAMKRGLNIKRVLFEKMFKLGIIKIAKDQHGNKVGYFIY